MPKPQLRSNGGGRFTGGGKTPKRNGVHREPRAKRDGDDEALLEAMRVDPAGKLAAWARR